MNREKKIVLLLLIAVLTSGSLVGCAEIQEAYLLNYLISPTGTDPSEMQAKEIMRKKFEYADYLDYTKRCPAPGGREDHLGPVMPILTIRF